MPNNISVLRHFVSSILMISVSSSILATSAHAGNMYIYKDKAGQVLLTNVSPSGNFDKFTKKVKTTYYKSSSSYDNNAGSDYGNNSYGSSTASSSSRRNAFDSYILDSANRHGVDPALMKAMMHTESAFNPNARSPVGAQGLMQLMPATARRFKVSNAWNPAENIEGSAKYIAWLMRRFDNNVEFAIAGYNAGEGNVDKYNGIPPFKETRNYVKSVMSRYHSLYKNDSGLFANNASISSASNGGMQNISFGTSSNVNYNANNNPNSSANATFDALRR